LSAVGPAVGGAARRWRHQGRRGREGALNTIAASTQALAKTARQKGGHGRQRLAASGGNPSV